MATPAPPPDDARRRRLIGVWALIAIGCLVFGILLATGRLNAHVLPKAADKPATSAVHCFEADGNPLSGWSTSQSTAEKNPPIDPVAICTALYQDHTAVDEMDRIATRQRDLGHDCVQFDDSDGGHWILTGIVLSQDGTYSASGGPAPGQLPRFGTVEQPAPLIDRSPAPVPAPPGACTTLPTVTWDLSAPAMTACTSNDVTVSVYVRRAGRSSSGVCAEQGLVVSAG
jgi:hypothetical protein